VGGTNPSLLRAIGAGAAVLAYDVDFNREVVAESGRFFVSPADVAALVEAAEADPDAVAERGRRARDLARGYDWDDVAAGYEDLALRLSGRRFPSARPSGRRTGVPERTLSVVPMPRPATVGESFTGNSGALPLPGAQR
jgi:hypothetical protein